MRFNLLILLITTCLISCSQKKRETESGGIDRIGSQSNIHVDTGPKADIVTKEALIYFQRGNEFTFSENWKKANNEFLKCHELEPQSKTILNSLGHSETKLQNYDNGEYYLLEVISLDSMYFPAYANLAQNYIWNFKFQEALQLCDFVIANSQNNMDLYGAHFQLCQVYVGLKDCGNAEEELNNAFSYASSTNQNDILIRYSLLVGNCGSEDELFE